MRRAKIRPSINLAASRRPVRASSTTSASSDRSLKSPAKNVPSSPAKTAPTVGAGSVTRSSRSSSSLSTPSKTEQSQPKVVQKQLETGGGGAGRVRRNSDVAQGKQTATEKEGQPATSKSSTPKPSSLASQSPATASATAASKQNDKPQQSPAAAAAAAAAPKGPRGRRKHVPNILNNRRSRPSSQQAQPAAGQATSSSDASKAKEGANDEKQSAGSEVENVSKVADDGGTLPPEPPPVQRLTSADKPVSASRIRDEAKSQEQPTRSSTSVQDLQIHQDAPVNTSKASASAKTSAAASTKTATTKNTGTPLKMIGPPDKKNPMNIYERKLRELKETLEEETPAKRRRRYVKKHMPSDRGNMTMSDLIYYNPKNNPMKQSAGAENRERTRTSSEIVTDLNQDDSDEDDHDHDVDQFAPQVKIGPDGELILDQKSLVKDASPKKTFDPTDSDIVHEEFSNTTYASFRKRTRTTNWTKKETEKFYKALSAVGTDFSMINAMFPKRTRTQIKNKFKREERHNHLKVDAAIRKTSKVSMSMFLASDDDSGSETENRPARVNKSKTATGRKRLSSGNAPVNAHQAQKQDEPEPNADTTENTPSITPSHQSEEEEEICPSENGDDVTPFRLPEPPRQDEDSEEDVDMETILSRPTRSGRQPKLRTNFTIEEPPVRVHARSKPGVKQPDKSTKVGQSLDQQDPVQQEKAQTGRHTEGDRPQTTAASITTPSICVAPSTTTPRTQNSLTRVKHIVINSPVTSLQATPSLIKTHIYVINSPDGTQRIVQVPATATPVLQTPSVRSSPLSPVVIHRVQTTQPQTSSAPLGVTTAVQSGAPAARAPVGAPTAPTGASVPLPAPQKIILNPQRLTTLSPAIRSIASGIVTSSLAKSPVKRFVLATPPKVQRKPLVLQDNTAVNVVPSTSQQHIQQLPATSTGAVNIAPRILVQQQQQLPSTSGTAENVLPRTSHHVVQQQQQQPQHVQLPLTSVTAVNVGPKMTLITQQQDGQQQQIQLPSTSATNVHTVQKSPHYIVHQQQPQHIQLPVTSPVAVNVPRTSHNISQQQQQGQQQHIQLPTTSTVAVSPVVFQQHIQSPTTSAAAVSSPKKLVLQRHIQSPSSAAVGSPNRVIFQSIDSGAESDPVVAQQIDIECYDAMSESGASESGSVFIPPISSGAKATENFTGMEQNSDQLMITGLGSDGLSTTDIFEQISYEQGVGSTGHESVGANMEVTISSDMISQIATEIATEK